MISGGRLAQLVGLIQTGNSHKFYGWQEWLCLRSEVLRLDNWECKLCKSRGRHCPAVIVHHVKHLQDRPDLALSVWDPVTGERQLVSVCKRCHKRLHPESQRPFARRRPPVTEERWD